MRLLVCYLNKLQNARCNDKDKYLGIHIKSVTQNTIFICLLTVLCFGSKVDKGKVSFINVYKRPAEPKHVAVNKPIKLVLCVTDLLHSLVIC